MFLAVLILGIRFIVWIFPVLILLILGYYIYRSIKINRTIRNMHNTTNNKNKDKKAILYKKHRKKEKNTKEVIKSVNIIGGGNAIIYKMMGVMW